jgi:hypothetical protein
MHVHHELDRLSLPDVRPWVQASEELGLTRHRAALDGLHRFCAHVVGELLRVLGQHRGRFDHEVHQHVGPQRLPEEH